MTAVSAGAIAVVLKRRSDSIRTNFSLPRFLVAVAISVLAIAGLCLYLADYTFPFGVLS